MSSEAGFLKALKALATHPAARGFTDDAAVLDIGGQSIVLTHDMIVEGVHFLPSDPPESVAWKLLAVNLSDLAAKGARPLGVLLGYPLGEAAWDAAFLAGLSEALDTFDVALLGGDTVTEPAAARTFALTAIGAAPETGAPARSGAQAGDLLYVTGTIGDAGLGLEIAAGRMKGPDVLLVAYRRPQPLLAEGRALAPFVHAMMDVSDGLLLDAERMAAASGCGVTIDLNTVPLSPDFTDLCGSARAARLRAAQAGDDYQLLFAATPGTALPAQATAVGRFSKGEGLSLHDADGDVPLPARLGYQHRSA